jgi:hypothetical protein
MKKIYVDLILEVQLEGSGSQETERKRHREKGGRYIGKVLD